MKLYELTAELLAIEVDLIESKGELTPEIEEKLAKVEGAFDGKADRIAALIQTLKRDGEGARAEATRLQELARSRENAADALKRYLCREMVASERRRIDTSRFRISVARNSRPSIAWVLEPEALPADYQRVSVSADTQLAYERWKAGEALPDGFTVTIGEHLRVR